EGATNRSAAIQLGGVVNRRAGTVAGHSTESTWLKQPAIKAERYGLVEVERPLTVLAARLQMECQGPGAPTKIVIILQKETTVNPAEREVPDRLVGRLARTPTPQERYQSVAPVLDQRSVAFEEELADVPSMLNNE